MTLEEAISKYTQRANLNEVLADAYYEEYNTYHDKWDKANSEECKLVADEYRQLTIWLKDYDKLLRKYNNDTQC